MKHDQEFSGGYARTQDLPAVVEAARRDLMSKDELRLFCAKLEHKEAGGRKPISSILGKKGRISLERSDERLSSALEACRPAAELTHKVPRRFLRAAAAGRLRASEILCYLLYLVHRMPQRKRRGALLPGERYGRLKIRDAAHLLGLAVSTVCEAFQRLRARGLLSSLKRRMWELKQFGQLLVDGPKLSLFSGLSEAGRRLLQKTGTHPAENRNANLKTLPDNSLKPSDRGRERKKDTFERLFQRCKNEFGVDLA